MCILPEGKVAENGCNALVHTTGSFFTVTSANQSVCGKLGKKNLRLQKNLTATYIYMSDH